MSIPILEEILSVIGTNFLNLLYGIGILVVGWVVVFLISKIVYSLLKKTKINNLTKYVNEGKEEKAPNDIAKWISRSVFWLLFIFVLIAFFNVINISNISTLLSGFMARIINYIPNVIAAGLLVVLAFFIATVVKLLVSKFIKMSKLEEKLEDTEGSEGSSLSEIISKTSYWLIIFLFLPAVLGALEINALVRPWEDMTSKIIEYIPNILGAVIILFAGWFLAKIIKQLVVSLIGASNISDWLGKMEIKIEKASITNIVGTIIYVVVLVPFIIASLESLDIASISAPSINMLNKIIAYIPDLIAAILIVVIAYFIARFVSKIAIEFLENLKINKLPEKLGFTNVSESFKVSKIIGDIIIVGIILLALVEASDKFGLPSISNIINDVASLFGRLLISSVILLAGIYLSNLIYNMIKGISGRKIISMLARVSVLVLFITMALSQLNIADEIITIAFGFLVGAVAVAVAIAFGVGGIKKASSIIDDWTKKIEKE